MGLLVTNFTNVDYLPIKTVYVSLFNFDLSKTSPNWICRFNLQAHHSREDKYSGQNAIFLTNSQQTSQFIYDMSSNIFSEVYKHGKLLVGTPENITNVFEDTSGNSYYVPDLSANYP